MSRPTVPPTPDRTDLACTGLDWFNHEADARRIATKRGLALTREPHAILGRFAVGTAAACAKWDAWSRKVRALLTLETRTFLRKAGACPTW